MGEKNRMSSTKVVFFKDENKLKNALDRFDIKKFKNQKFPLKIHMGEMKNKYFPRPEFVKKVVELLQNYNAEPFLFDTTVAYNALRKSKTGYEKLAKIHGFSKKKIGCDVVIDDSGKKVTVDKRDYEVADHIYNSDYIFSFAHVKGHNATGMGGAIKNFGMGGVTKETKRRMHHGSRPEHKVDKCTYCGVCAEVCPFGDIKVDKEKEKWSHNKNCFGCGVCVNACEHDALKFQDADFQYVLACAAKACLENKKVIYLNDVNRIAKLCDCHPSPGPIICPDIGYLISDDPVAIDQASLDLVHKKKPDIFQKENNVDPAKQLRYGEEIGLGSRSYELVEI